MTAPDETIATWLPRRDRCDEPWRNGGGSTRQVAIDPPGATVQSGFRWRISLARIAADGPFSLFPGVDRALWLLAGAGLELAMAGRVVRLVQPLERLDFAGETAVAARLLGGPTEDLNVMSDRAAVDAMVELVRLPAGEVRHLELREAQHVVLVIAGELDVPRWSRSLGELDALRLDGAATLDVRAAAAPAIVLLASFRARPRVTSRAP
jgi:environmental stress-induced protein Ves